MIVKLVLCVLISYACISPVLRAYQESKKDLDDCQTDEFEEKVAVLREKFKYALERQRRFPTSENCEEVNKNFFALLGAIRGNVC